MGGYFIKRRMDPKTGVKDHIYRGLLEAYLESLLMNKFDLGFFLEGTRSRTGKPMIPKGESLISERLKRFTYVTSTVFLYAVDPFCR
jgi:glycerol-3-phosphate O-acyltransferase